MLVEELRSGLQHEARTERPTDVADGRRAVDRRVRRHARRTLAMSASVLVLMLVLGVIAFRARSAHEDLGVTSGAGHVSHLVPSYVPGDWPPSRETIDFAGDELLVAGGMLPSTRGPGYAIAWGADPSGSQEDIAARPPLFLTVSNRAPVDLGAVRKRYPDATSIDINGEPGLLVPLPDPHDGWFVTWTLDGADVGAARGAVPR